MMKKIVAFWLFFCSFNAFAYYADDIQNKCGNNIYQLAAIFTPNSYTCASGYYLPANTDGCRPCPIGYRCDGGTFVFNPRQSQGAQGTSGLIKQNIAYACSSNMLHYMNADFTQNVISINWEGVDSPTTCTYGDSIVLPQNVPERPGYRFTGWKLKND